MRRKFLTQTLVERNLIFLACQLLKNNLKSQERTKEKSKFLDIQLEPKLICGSKLIWDGSWLEMFKCQDNKPKSKNTILETNCSKKESMIMYLMLNVEMESWENYLLARGITLMKLLTNFALKRISAKFMWNKSKNFCIKTQKQGQVKRRILSNLIPQWK